MGMYTELVLALELKRDVPDEVVEILRRLIWNLPMQEDMIPAHPFFQTKRWYRIFSGNHLAFPGQPHSGIQLINYFSGSNYCLTVRSNLKNVDGEIELFLSWLMPYIETEGFVGYQRHSEAVLPNLLFVSEGKVYNIPLIDQSPAAWLRWLKEHYTDAVQGVPLFKWT